MTLRPYSATLQAAYRETLGTPGAPELIDDGTPVQPVAVVAQVNTASTSSYTRITDGTDTAAINTDGSFPISEQASCLPYGATPICKYVYQVNTGTTIHTVTAGKTFYLMGYSLNAGAAGDQGITVNGTQICKYYMAANAINNVAASKPIASAAATQTIVLTHGAGAGQGIATIWGYEI